MSQTQRLRLQVGRAVVIAGMLGSAAACGSGQGGGTTASGGASGPASFPSPTDIAALVRGTPPRLDIQPTSTLVERWTLDGALPAKVGTVRRPPSTRWDTALADAARGKPGVTLTEAMHCTAREVGRFYLEHRKRPSQGLEQFIISRCGSAAVTVGVGMVGADVTASTTEDQFAASVADLLADLLTSSVSDGAREVGIWFGRGDDYGVVAVASGRPEVDIARVAHVPDDSGRIVIEGKLLVAAQSARALISSGAYAASRCAMDPLVALPRFVAFCLPNPADETAWVELAVFPPDRVLGHTALRVLVWPAGQPPTQYVRLAYNLTRLGATDPADALMEMIAATRVAAGVPEVKVAAEEAVTATALAGHYFAAAPGSPRLTDRIALGLMAGWQVPATIRRGHFASRLLVSTANPEDLLAALLESPSGRETVLGPDAEYLALGVVSDARTGYIGALITTYALFDDIKPDDAGFAVRDQLAMARALKSRTVPQNFVAADELVEDAARSVREGERTPRQAMDALVATLRARQVQGRAWLLTGPALEELQLPPELIAQPTVAVAVAVAVHKPEGKPWGAYYAFLVASL